jgi:hypothetical protein
MLVVNKNIDHANHQKTQDIYKTIKEICLDGCLEDASNNGIGKQNDDGEYVYGSMLNFDFIFYTATLKNLDEYAQGTGPSQECYFDQYDNKDLLIQIYKIDKDFSQNTLIEQPISNLDKSNMYQAYIEQKERL